MTTFTAWLAANLDAETFDRLIARWGGTVQAIQSQEALARPARNLAMVQEHRRGDSYTAIARRHRVSVRTVRRVVDVEHPKAA